MIRGKGGGACDVSHTCMALIFDVLPSSGLPANSTMELTPPNTALVRLSAFHDVMNCERRVWKFCLLI